MASGGGTRESQAWQAPGAAGGALSALPPSCEAGLNQRSLSKVKGQAAGAGDRLAQASRLGEDIIHAYPRCVSMRTLPTLSEPATSPEK